MPIPFKMLEKEIQELQQFLIKHKETQNGLILNFGTESIESGIPLSKDKVYLRKDVAEFVIKQICNFKIQ